MEEQFAEFRAELDETGSVYEQLRIIAANLDSFIRLMQAALMPIHHCSFPQVKEKVKGYMSDLCGLYAQLAHVIKDKPGQYYRYHDLWRNQTSTVVFVLAFLHWLDTGGLLTHTETEALLNLDPAVFGIDLEDYLIGLCSFSNELPRYVVNRVTAGDYNCPKEVSTFLGDLYTAFRTLNLRNDHLRKRFDGIKYDLKKVEEVLYDVKIRGLLNGPSLQATATGHESNVATNHQ
ncbi:unnamed protein product [Sphagnum troendelagicum]